MLVGHEFDDVYLFCFLQHYLNDKTVFWTNSYLGLFSTSFAHPSRIWSREVEGRAICPTVANEFYASLKDSKERRTRRALKTECFQSGLAVSHRQHHIINMHSACERYSNSKSTSKGLGKYGLEWTEHQPVLFARWWIGLFGAACTEYLWPSSISHGRVMLAETRASLWRAEPKEMPLKMLFL